MYDVLSLFWGQGVDVYFHVHLLLLHGVDLILHSFNGLLFVKTFRIVDHWFQTNLLCVLFCDVITGVCCDFDPFLCLKHHLCDS